MDHETNIDRDAELLVELLYGERDVEDTEISDDTRAELESLGELRSLFRSMPEEDPSSAVSAKLLAAAAQHAPKAKSARSEESGGFFAWLAGLVKPMAMHPGLAAAASLVLVAGVAGALYVSGRQEIAQPGKDTAAGAESSVARDGDRGSGLDSLPGAEERERDEPALEATPPSPSEEKTEDSQAAGPPIMKASPEPDRRTADKRSARQQGASPGPTSTAPPSGRVRATRIEGVVGGDVIPAEPKQDQMPKDKARDSFRDLGDVESDKQRPSRPAPDTGGRSFDGSGAGSGADDADDDGGDSEDAARVREDAPTSSGTSGAKKKQKEKESATRLKAKKFHGTAAAAAVSGDCKKALEYGQKIRTLDSRYYDDVFLSDDRVRKCRTAGKKK